MDSMKPSQASFCHPYQPYQIQVEFMDALYRCIEDGQIGIFESPTGTGKSLSLICGSLTWLRDNARRTIEQSLAVNAGDEDDPPWMIEAAKAEKKRQMLRDRQELEMQLAAIREKEDWSHRRQESYVQRQKRQKLWQNHTQSFTDEDEQFLLADYDSDVENMSQVVHTSLSATTAALLEKLKPQSAEQVTDEPAVPTRIFFCSRTHSQLSQFVSELRRVTPPRSITAADDETAEHVKELLKHISLGSRKNLCVNPKVASLHSATLINERCRELQKPGLPQDQKCKYLPARGELSRWTGFRDHAIAKIRDIEDLVDLGSKLEVCPYYASRATISSSEIVTLPYPLLLQKSARDTLKLALKGQIVIIDEAHNLMDAITSANSASVTISQLERSIAQVTAYVQKFRNRLKGKNRVYATQILRLLHSVTGCAQARLQENPKLEQVIKGSDLMAGKGVDQINPFKLSIYIQESKLALKVESYSRNQQEKENVKKTQKPDLSVRGEDLTTAQTFLLCLMNPSDEGIIYLTPSDGEPRLRYTLLDPKNHFQDIVEDARSVVLAGGTMSPMSDYVDYLFPYVTAERLMFQSFGHVIPPSNLMALSLNSGAGRNEFDFTFEKRDSPAMIQEVGLSLLHLCRAIPDGIVAFFPSYDYLKTVVNQLQRRQNSNSVEVSEVSLLERIGSIKPVFFESKDPTSATTDIFVRYSKSIDSGKGGLLLSVIGGKLSEGINFSDKLGRAVIVIGLPFPNVHSAEWKAKLCHVEKLQLQRFMSSAEASLHRIGNATTAKSRAKQASRDYYENACMRAVNQCIGRAIRHRNDYAAIILMDKRYQTERIQRKLPSWILGRLDNERQQSWNFSNVTAELKRFFESREP